MIVIIEVILKNFKCDKMLINYFDHHIFLFKEKKNCPTIILMFWKYVPLKVFTNLTHWEKAKIFLRLVILLRTDLKLNFNLN